MRGPDVELSIQRLVLQGVGPVDRVRLAASVERELSRLFVERGVPPGLVGGSLAHLRAPSVRIPPGIGGEGLGRAVAGSLYRGLAP